MNRERMRRRLGWALVIASLALHLLTVVAFSRQPDILAAYTVMPIWIWGALGLLLSCCAFLFFRASLSLIMTGIWAMTVLLGADEAKTLANFGKPDLLPGPAQPYKGLPVIRLLTINCAYFAYGDPTEDIHHWRPDLVFLQEVSPVQVKRIADTLFGGQGDYRFHESSGIVSRWKIKREVRNRAYRNEQITVQTPGGINVELVNLHLTSAATDLELWKPSAWKEHRRVREERRRELYTSLRLLEKTAPFPSRPTLLGGDFNSPASDPVHTLLAPDFIDAYKVAKTAWPNTFHRRVPLFRLDCLYASHHFVPVRAKVVTTRNTDHRFVIADLILGES